MERQLFFRPDQCKKELPKGGRLTEKTWHVRSWFECRESHAPSWIPVGADAGASRFYEAEVLASDANGLSALLAPLSPQERASLAPGELERTFQRSFQGPGRWSFFVVGTGSTVTAYAVADLDDFQFADLAADFSSSSATMATEPLDFATLAQGAGVKLSYHTEISHRPMPPPGGMLTDP